MYNDEHPEIPITQRASRYLDDTLDSPFNQQTSNEKRSRTARNGETSTRMPRVSRPPRAPKSALDVEETEQPGRRSTQHTRPSGQTQAIERTRINNNNPLSKRPRQDDPEQPYSAARARQSRIERYQAMFLTDDALEDHHSQPEKSASTGRLPTINKPPKRRVVRERNNSERSRSARSNIWSEQDALEYGNEETNNFEERINFEDDYRESPSRSTGKTRRISLDVLDEDEPTNRNTTGRQRAIQTRRNQPVLYEANNAHEIQQRIARRERRRQQAIQDNWQRILHNRTVLTIIGIAAALLIVFTLISNSLNHSTTQLQSTGNTTTQGQQQSTQGTNSTSSVLKPANPHELIVTPPPGNHPAPPVLATSAYLLDANSGATLYAYNPFMHIPMMSTTKLMTALLILEHGENLDQSITINNQIAQDLDTQLSPDSSIMGIKKGETYTIRELLYGLFLDSGNDAALALADTDAGSVPAFVNKMNQRAQQLGLYDTHFRNPHGLLADGHYSSAHDLAFLARAAFANPTIKQISDTTIYQIPATSQHAAHWMQNESQFLYWYPGADAGKTGWDAAANFVQIVEVTRGNHRLIGAVMHTDDWWTDMRNLMNYGFNDYTWISPRELIASGHNVPFAAEWSYFERDTRDHSIPMGPNGRFYNFTGYGISGTIMSFFDQNKGLAKFGYPISQPQANGTNAISQIFQHGTIVCDLTTQKCHTT
jgi:D-alanyl-D-alanine carboxypeptidase